MNSFAATTTFSPCFAVGRLAATIPAAVLTAGTMAISPAAAPIIAAKEARASSPARSASVQSNRPEAQSSTARS
ncbi:hypothetical protein GCM10009712_04980 [Pseudarthrobacter sulfonivorans]